MTDIATTPASPVKRRSRVVLPLLSITFLLLPQFRSFYFFLPEQLNAGGGNSIPNELVPAQPLTTTPAAVVQPRTTIVASPPTTTTTIALSKRTDLDNVTTAMPANSKEASVDNFTATIPTTESPKFASTVQKVDNTTIPELFFERLERLLPVSDTTTRWYADSNLAALEDELLTFDIPRNVTVQIRDADYVSIQFYRWMFEQQQSQSPSLNKCPRCHLRFDVNAHRAGTTQDDSNIWYRNSRFDDGIPDVKFDMACPSKNVPSGFRQTDWQILIGSCGESQKGSGAAYATMGRQYFDRHAGFEIVDDGLFQLTYAHGHLSPDDRYGFPTLRNVTDMVRLLLRPSALVRFRQQQKNYNDTDARTNATIDYPMMEPEPSMFVHNNCGGLRGRLVQAAAREQKRQNLTSSINLMADYSSCIPFSSKNKPDWTRAFERPCNANPDRFHNDCEATRDGGKTILSSLHKFAFALENTLSPNYFTEKRWQVLMGGSVPIVWTNDDSLDSLPDPSAALLLDPQKPLDELARSVVEELSRYQNNNNNETTTADEEYEKRYFAWKEQGLTNLFLRKLFLSTDYLVCRMCEYAAHHQSREP